ncbi:predicted protein [Streptomyces filamentosus NRRL 15998]|uniref:Predicted protein n=1 Tax=Streptomyces filamentosus NRRL 15998 TaxID=457431 RepID=D6AI53_STRFL|nr:predicted protein [Streptomyces filamentosus NRRL 15998]
MKAAQLSTGLSMNAFPAENIQLLFTSVKFRMVKLNSVVLYGNSVRRP